METNMDRDALKAKLTDIFRKTFDNDELTISESTTADDVAGWDSLSHINLVLAVERGFGIRLTTREVRGMKNVGDLVELIAKKSG
jgi:acyl carrier protein